MNTFLYIILGTILIVITFLAVTFCFLCSVDIINDISERLEERKKKKQEKNK